MPSKEELQKRITEIKEELKDVHGSKCQVYSRVVGYLRPVQNWNDGKVEEFRARTVYNVGDGEAAKDQANQHHRENMARIADVKCLRKCV